MHNVEKREIQNSNNPTFKGDRGGCNKKIILYFSFFGLYGQTLFSQNVVKYILNLVNTYYPLMSNFGLWKSNIISQECHAVVVKPM